MSTRREPVTMCRFAQIVVALLAFTACSGSSSPAGDPGGVADAAGEAGDAGLSDTAVPLDANDPGTPDAQPDVPCVRDCTNRRCGDDGCGGSCGTCPWNLECEAGKCLPPMVDVPAGMFWMGCNEAVDGECQTDEWPYHQVRLKAYHVRNARLDCGGRPVTPYRLETQDRVEVAQAGIGRLECVLAAE